MQTGQKIAGMKRQKTFKKMYLKSDEVEYLARKNKEGKRNRKEQRKNKKVVRKLTTSC